MAIVSHGKIADHVDTFLGAIAADATTNTGDFVDVSGHRQIFVAVQAANSTAGGDVTVQLRQAPDTAGTGATDFGDPFVLTVGAGEQAAGAFGEYVEGLADGNTHIAVQLDGLSDAATSAAFVLGEGRYKG